MNEKLIKAMLAKISAAFQNFKINKHSPDVWLEGFKGFHPQDVADALNEYIREETFPPTIADIRKKTIVYRKRREIIEFNKKEEQLLLEASPEDQKKVQKLLSDLSSKLKRVK